MIDAMVNINSLRREMLQYGFSVRKLPLWLGQGRAPPVLANSIPKAGTNLLTRILYLSPLYRRALRPTLVGDADFASIAQQIHNLKSSSFRPAHLYYDPRVEKLTSARGIRHILMVRDPRDVVISNARYLSDPRSRHRLHGYFRQLKNENERIIASVVGVPSSRLEGAPRSRGMKEHMLKYLPWLECSSVLCVRFEDLVGSKGGGCDNTQRQVIGGLFEHLELETSNAQIEGIAARVFSANSRTFFKGQAYLWKSESDDEVRRILRNELDEVARLFGYEMIGANS